MSGGNRDLHVLWEKICSWLDYTGKFRHGSTVGNSDAELDIKTLQVSQVVLWLRVFTGVWYKMLSFSFTDQNAWQNRDTEWNTMHSKRIVSLSQSVSFMWIISFENIYESHSAHLVSAILTHLNNHNDNNRSACVDSCYMSKGLTKPFICEHFDSLTPQCGAQASTVSNYHLVSIYHMPALVCLNTSFRETH